MALLIDQSSAQPFRTLYSFTGYSGPPTNSDGAGPGAALLLWGTNLYGTAAVGGNSGNGTVFAINIDGTGFTNLHSFSATIVSVNTNSDGSHPYGELVASGNTLYGTANSAGKWGSGTVFALNTDGTGFHTLHDFSYVGNTTPISNSDGAHPMCSLTLSGSTLYGTTSDGGKWGSGTGFAINTDGTGFTNLHDFSAVSYDPSIGRSLNAEGAYPDAGLVLLSNRLYGTATAGGSSGNGTIFALNIDGTGYAVLHSFAGFTERFQTNSDGVSPRAALILSGNSLYGTATRGGDSGFGTIFKINADGTGFTNLYSFSGFQAYGITYAFSSDGDFPYGRLLLVSNILFGTANQGGNTNASPFLQSYGTVFAVYTDGTGFTPLWRFSAASNTNYSNADGANPMAGLLVVSNTLYGTAQGGGLFSNGTIFSLPMVLRPEVPPPTHAAPIFADFSTSTIQSSNMTVTPGPYFDYNTNFPGSWDIAAESFGFTATFTVPLSGTYLLSVNHQTSPAPSCPGGGYSPVNISVNGTQIASNFDPAQNSGGSLGEVTNSWVITATAGSDNTLQWTAGRLCSRYWIQGIQITPVPSPILNLSVASNSVVLFWNTNLSGFVLESSTNLGGIWAQVSPPPTVIDATNFTTNSLVGSSQFYRLHNPSGQ